MEREVHDTDKMKRMRRVIHVGLDTRTHRQPERQRRRLITAESSPLDKSSPPSQFSLASFCPIPPTLSPTAIHHKESHRSITTPPIPTPFITPAPAPRCVQMSLTEPLPPHWTRTSRILFRGWVPPRSPLRMAASLQSLRIDLTTGDLRQDGVKSLHADAPGNVLAGGEVSELRSLGVVLLLLVLVELREGMNSRVVTWLHKYSPITRLTRW